MALSRESTHDACLRRRHRPAERIAICVEHHWWFTLDKQSVAACPEPGCRADVQLYEARERVPYLAVLGDG